MKRPLLEELSSAAMVELGLFTFVGMEVDWVDVRSVSSGIVVGKVFVEEKDKNRKDAALNTWLTSHTEGAMPEHSSNRM